MDKEQLNFMNGVLKGLLLAERAVAEAEGNNLVPIEAIRSKITKLEEIHTDNLSETLGI